MVIQEEARGLVMGASAIMVFRILAAVSITFLQSQVDTIATIGWLLGWLGYVALLTSLVWAVVIRPLRQTEKLAAAEAALRIATTERAVSRDETAEIRKEFEAALMDAFAAKQETASARAEAAAAREETEAARAAAVAAAARSPGGARGNITVLTCTREKECVKVMPLRRGSSAPSLPSSESDMESSDLASFQQRVAAAADNLRRSMAEVDHFPVNRPPTAARRLGTRRYM